MSVWGRVAMGFALVAIVSFTPWLHFRVAGTFSVTLVSNRCNRLRWGSMLTLDYDHLARFLVAHALATRVPVDPIAYFVALGTWAAYDGMVYELALETDGRFEVGHRLWFHSHSCELRLLSVWPPILPIFPPPECMTSGPRWSPGSSASSGPRSSPHPAFHPPLPLPDSTHRPRNLPCPGQTLL